MWAKGYIIGTMWGATLVACLLALDMRPGMIVIHVVVITFLGLAMVELLSAWVERKSR